MVTVIMVLAGSSSLIGSDKTEQPPKDKMSTKKKSFILFFLCYIEKFLVDRENLDQFFTVDQIDFDFVIDFVVHQRNCQRSDIAEFTG